jgi:hypothetical protein
MKKMIKKVGVVFTILSIMSMTSADEKLTECEILGVNVHNDAIDAGFSHSQAYNWSAFMQFVCEQNQ